MTRTRLAGSAGTGTGRAGISLTRIGQTGICLAVGLSMVACGRIGLNDPLARETSQTSYEPLPAAPTTAVTSSALPPPPPVTAPTATAGTPVDPMQPGQSPTATAAGIPIASANPSKPAEPVASDKGPAFSRGDFVGAWRIASGSDNCQLFVSLTSWSGGYRASTKGCNSVELQHVSAWDSAGKQVALKNGDGSVVALLSNAGAEKYAGTTTSKQSIALSR